MGYRRRLCTACAGTGGGGCWGVQKKVIDILQKLELGGGGSNWREQG